MSQPTTTEPPTFCVPRKTYRGHEMTIEAHTHSVKVRCVGVRGAARVAGSWRSDAVTARHDALDKIDATLDG